MSDDVEELIRAALVSGDRDGDAWRRAVEGLRAAGGEDALARALALAAGAGRRPRALACDALGQLGASDASLRDRIVPVLVEALDDPDALVRTAAAVALSRQRDARVVHPLAGLRRDADPEVRHAVAFGLGGFDDPLALDALVELSGDERPAVRDWATFALGSLTRVTTPALVAALVARLDDPDEQTRDEAIVGLVERRGSDEVASVLSARLAVDGPLGRGPLEAAARLGDPRLLAVLLGVTAVSDTERLLLEHAIYACSPDDEDPPAEGGPSR